MKKILISCLAVATVLGCASRNPNDAQFGEFGFTYDLIQPVSGLTDDVTRRAVLTPTPQTQLLEQPQEAAGGRLPYPVQELGSVTFYQAMPTAPNTSLYRPIMIIPRPPGPGSPGAPAAGGNPPPAGGPPGYAPGATQGNGTAPQGYAPQAYPQGYASQGGGGGYSYGQPNYSSSGSSSQVVFATNNIFVQTNMPISPTNPVTMLNTNPFAQSPFVIVGSNTPNMAIRTNSPVVNTNPFAHSPFVIYGGTNPNPASPQTGTPVGQPPGTALITQRPFGEPQPPAAQPFLNAPPAPPPTQVATEVPYVPAASPGPPPMAPLPPMGTTQPTPPSVQPGQPGAITPAVRQVQPVLPGAVPFPKGRTTPSQGGGTVAPSATPAMPGTPATPPAAKPATPPATSK